MSHPAGAIHPDTITIGGDLTVARLGFGAMRVCGRGAWGDPPDRKAAIALLRRVVERGVTLIDTADSYGPGTSESLIAEALHPYPEDLVIATKGGLQRTGPGQWPADGRPQHLRAACNGSLQRLRLEQIPLYQFHRPDPKVPFEDSVGMLAELKNEGKIRHVGLSNVTERQLDTAMRLTPIVSVQNRYSRVDRSSEAMLDRCESEAIAFLPWAPIEAGRIGDDSSIARVAATHEVTPHQVALAWLLARSPVLLPIPGTGSVAHLEENQGAASLRLSPGEVTQLSRA